ncbi:hypothetical protein psyc5s11_26640 [Clostridium gelidum]|uniref:ABC-2 family transporter protein n=1 Tax=Clostridium gelidum TaxID=704125 RepID=A0ABN6IWV3_9CLOT|nr:ABC transporter permease [Clostridium gelidum]BCZ46597.1 hypothetical protein psyc5s11_26640 [Clostridium gelidum]
MTNLIKAEIYKYSKRPFTYIATLLLCIGTFLVTALVAGKFSGIAFYTREKFLSLTFTYFPLILILMMVFCPVISEEYKEGTFKNLCASNISKSKIFFSRFIVQIILAVVIATMCMIVFLLSVNMIITGDSYSSEMLKGFTFRFIASTPIFLGGITIVNLLVILIKKEAIVCVIYYIIMQIRILTFILEKLLWNKFGVIREFLLSTQLEIVGDMNSTTPEIIKAVLIGLVYTVVLTIITAIIFNKQDIK